MLESPPTVERPSISAPVSGFDEARLGWLIRLRWIALGGIVVATCLSALGAFPGVRWSVLAGAAVVAGLYNGFLWRAHARGVAATGGRAAMAQALGDFLLLTVVLWAAGGVKSPFVGFYVFHVALVGILAGPRATLVAAGMALACVNVLWLTDLVPVLRIGVWEPSGLWGPLADGFAFVSTLGAVAYLVTHSVAELRDREQALQEARQSAELEYELLSNTLNELDAGMEVLDSANRVVWKNRLARELVPTPPNGDWHCPGLDHNCERDATASCPILASLERREPGRCRFSVQLQGAERLYELLSFPLTHEGGEGQRVMNLYLDRTNATLQERQLMLAERLASLGRVAQGVAHELNTPLATIRTLATDMGDALQGVQSADSAAREVLLKDVGESASLIRDETGRLGRITQALLAGGDLVRTHIRGAVPLGAVVERASALVFAGVREAPLLVVDPEVDGIRLTADHDRMVQVLVNLLQNAHDAVRNQGHGGIRVGAKSSPEGVEIVVEDDGPGLDSAIQGRLFEPFATTKPPGEGTGLGLYTSYMLVVAMHGTLDLEPRSEGGTRATIRLPAGRAETRDGSAERAGAVG